MEMGALDGMKFSNTYAFSKALNWTGVLIEPSPSSFRRLQKNRPESTNINAAVCERERSVRFVGRGTEVDGIWEFMAPSFRKQFHKRLLRGRRSSNTIQCKPLTSLVDTSNNPYFDFFSLDVEGAELQVLRSIDFSKIGFGVVFFEADGRNAAKEKEATKILKEAGYKFCGHRSRSMWFLNRDIACMYEIFNQS
eukprot:CAMPEP_0177586924 /NCGR_PEP_ID=MMETSP0419_2-20121207/5352_1 /TAXON_ID=582737 /ORGANISM="Tetraselmis sp., Strain GSL018" /LENGTH=193 /DNA_ID=CAMNT_0019076889 /DNA_START=451 /DNA_END=1032 /DNA_ORIENTATION=+